LAPRHQEAYTSLRLVEPQKVSRPPSQIHYDQYTSNTALLRIGDPFVDDKGNSRVTGRLHRMDADDCLRNSGSCFRIMTSRVRRSGEWRSTILSVRPGDWQVRRSVIAPPGAVDGSKCQYFKRSDSANQQAAQDKAVTIAIRCRVLNDIHRCSGQCNASDARN
jgi:hypothetical protein